MKTKELLEKHPLATEVVRKWFFEKMLESVKLADDVPQDFKDAMMAEGITNERLIIFIDSQPRTLFDVFDEHDLSINIIRTPNSTEEWDWEIMQAYAENSVCKSRKEAELSAIVGAFRLLEEKLTPLEFPQLQDESVNND